MHDTDRPAAPPTPPPPSGVKSPETTVTIDTPGVTVTITTAGHLDAVAAKALEVFHAAGGWPQHRDGPAGFAQVERGEAAAAGSSMWEPVSPVGFGRSAP